MASTASTSSPKDPVTSASRPHKHHKKAVPIRLMPLENSQSLPSPTNEFKCAHCSETFEYKSSLIIHEMSHKRMTTCGVCSKQIFMGNIDEHLKSHHETKMQPEVQPEKLFECDLCPKVCEQKVEMAIHMVSYHQRIRRRKIVEKESKDEEARESFECLICHKIFTSLTVVQRHVKLHSEDFDGEKFKVVKEKKEFEGQVMKNGKLGKRLRKELKAATGGGFVTVRMNNKSGEKENEENGGKKFIHSELKVLRVLEAFKGLF